MEGLTILGAGGIGCAVGHALATNGWQLTFVDADPAKVAWGRRQGVQVAGKTPQQAQFLAFADWEPKPDGRVLLCTKCYDNATVLARLPESTTLLPIQNGFDPGIEERSSGPEGIASFVSECDPGTTRTRITRTGRLHLGGRDGKPLPPPGAKLLADVGNALRESRHFRVEMVSNILPYKYTKLMYNAAISPLAAAAGLDNGRLLSHPPARRLFFQLLRENYAILQEAEVPLGKIGPLHPRTVAAILRSPLVAHSLAWAFYPGLRGTYCSMSGDLPRGRTEVEYYNGWLLKLAGSRSFPLNRAVYSLVRRMEKNLTPPHLGVFDELERASTTLPPLPTESPRQLSPPLAGPS